MSRRRSRQLILQILYRNEFHSDSTSGNVNSFVKDKNLSEADGKFVLEILKGIQNQRTDIDETIRKYSINWKQERISLVDLNIMRIAVFEILFYPDVPGKVALNEALELAKDFGEKNSVSFINGILNQVLQNKISI